MEVKKMPFSSNAQGKQPYTSPTLTNYGTLSQLTLGTGGSSIDGGGTFTQRGGGNDGGVPGLP